MRAYSSTAAARSARRSACACTATAGSRLREAGFSAQLADTLARDCAYDLHALLNLVDRGCPAALAARILAPLDEERRPC